MLGGRYGRIDSREHRRRIGSAGSAIEASLRPDLTPVTIVMTARHAATEPWWHVYSDDDRRGRAACWPGLASKTSPITPYGTLSAGERRRTSIARALMPDPDLLLLDEPGASLDLGARETLIATSPPRGRRPASGASCSSPITSRRSRPGSATPWCWPAGARSRPARSTTVLTDESSRGVRDADRRRVARRARAKARRRRDPHTRMSHRTAMMARVSTATTRRRRPGRPPRPPSRDWPPRSPGSSRSRRHSASRSSRRPPPGRDLARRRRRPDRHRPPAAGAKDFVVQPLRDERQARPRGAHRRRRVAHRGRRSGSSRGVVTRSLPGTFIAFGVVGFLASLGDPLATRPSLRSLRPLRRRRPAGSWVLLDGSARRRPRRRARTARSPRCPTGRAARS